MDYTVRFILNLIRTFGTDVDTDFGNSNTHSAHFTVGSTRYALRFNIDSPMIQLWRVDRDGRFGVIVAEAIGPRASFSNCRYDAFVAIRRSAGVTA